MEIRSITGTLQRFRPNLLGQDRLGGSEIGTNRLLPGGNRWLEYQVKSQLKLCWGYSAIRIDKREHNNKIDDEIIAAIRRAKFLVADFSCDEQGARGGVYFEAGFAAGLGKPVIFTVRRQDLERVHFDTRQYNHLVWETPVDLRVALENRVGATIGEAEPL